MTETVYRKLGNTGFDVSSVGFGTWQLGGGRWRAADDAECVELLRGALDLGVNVYDAAVVYGQYHDERRYPQSRSQDLLGRAFHDRRDRVHLCVKLGQYDEYSHRSCYDAERLVEQLQQSLRRLRTDYVDVCLIHAPALVDVRRGAAIEVLRAFRALGLVRAIGYSFEAEPEHVTAALAQDVDVVMLQYNLLDTACAGVLADAAEHGVGILVGGPYKRGYLTGRFAHPADLPGDDDYWQWNLARNPGKVAATLREVRRLMAGHPDPRAFRRYALRHVLDAPGVASAVVGHRALAEVTENLDHAAPARDEPPAASPDRSPGLPDVEPADRYALLGADALTAADMAGTSA